MACLVIRSPQSMRARRAGSEGDGSRPVEISAEHRASGSWRLPQVETRPLSAMRLVRESEPHVGIVGRDRIAAPHPECFCRDADAGRGLTTLVLAGVDSPDYVGDERMIVAE